MTHEDFSKLQLQLIDKVLKISETKGKEYANNDNDRLANFKRAAQRKGITPLVALGVYLDKHMDSIDSYIKHERTFSEENIEGRIVDAITYLTLMWGLIIEQTRALEDSFDNLINPDLEKKAVEQQEKFINKNPNYLKEQLDFVRQQRQQANLDPQERRHAMPMILCKSCNNQVPESKFVFLTNCCVDCENTQTRLINARGLYTKKRENE